jgi:hypothetical protein
MSAAVSGLAITTAAAAVAEANGVGATPAMGWSSWSFIRHDPTAADIVQSRFAQVADWQPDGGPGAFNDYDSIEAGNGPADDGITDAEAQSQLSLWAMAASPLLLGIDAGRIVSHVNQQVFAKKEQNGQ